MVAVQTPVVRLKSTAVASWVASVLVLVIAFWLRATVPGSAAGCVSRFDGRVDYFSDKSAPRFARAFSVEYHRHYKIVTVRDPWRGAVEPLRYVLVQCGTPVPAGFPRARVIQVPVSSVAVLSTTHLPLLEKLGLLDTLVAVADPELIHSEAIQQRLRSGRIATVGKEAAIDVERLLELQPQLVTAFAISPDTDDFPRLTASGLKVVLNAEYRENTPLGRSEWLKFLALFFNKEALANRLFDGIVQRYSERARLVRGITHRPTVFAGFAMKDSWYVPGGKSYLARFLADAGADYLWATNPETGGVPLSFEAVYERAADAEFWLGGSLNWRSIQDVIAEDSRYNRLRAVRQRRVYNDNLRLNPAGGNDYWQGGIVNPDLILSDLIRIFHPERLPGYELVYYRPLK
ncbi:periplasmic binding protein [Gloeobacter kilaueensis JS1]|uniref:Periplasmic binding protein n=1 Tax=Gloeobacter kilaueensis (strain ATCC BAA-2537 / CCAP 1431/1 / ULC 316 / JS1) TaxID=1183438 RepID=U5QBU4_GLOK1|nr:periplasmic binding protein [Gloeobacter kilaueensis JS1]